jgi:hypothetical protein
MYTPNPLQQSMFVDSSQQICFMIKKVQEYQSTISQCYEQVKNNQNLMYLILNSLEKVNSMKTHKVNEKPIMSNEFLKMMWSSHSKPINNQMSPCPTTSSENVHSSSKEDQSSSSSLSENAY